MKRIISILLSIILLTGAVMIPVEAESLVKLRTGSLVTFGSYPQSRVYDETLLNRLRQRESKLKWKSFEYYADGKQGDFMKYADVTVSGERYRAVSIGGYRPLYWNSTYVAEEEFDFFNYGKTFQDNNGYDPGTYWFRFDPVVWRVLDADKGLMMTENIIDSQPFQNVVYNTHLENTDGEYINSYAHYFRDIECTNPAADWANCSLHTWLNDDFYNTAFDTEQDLIQETYLETPSTYGEAYNSAPTNDRVFLLTYEDVTNESYGFASDNSSDINKKAVGTNYAYCQGLIRSYNFDTYEYEASPWYLRTPGDNINTSLFFVDGQGYIEWADSPGNSGTGVRPAIVVDLQKGLSENLIKEFTNAPDGIRTGSHVAFGSYPQSRVTDKDLCDKLEAKLSQKSTWKYYDYYCDGKPEQFMQYADVSLSGGDKYRAVKFSHYRPYQAGGASGDISCQHDNGYEPTVTYWFKYEPVVWRVLDADAGLLMTESIIDSQPFDNRIEMQFSEEEETETEQYVSENQWDPSSLKKWLNNDFYNTTFIDDEKKSIKHIADTDLFLLASYDISRVTYGFAPGFGGESARVAYGTDYAKCQGLDVDESGGMSGWYIRDKCEDTDYTGVGVRPAVYVDLKSAISASLLKRVDMSADEVVSKHVKYPGKEFQCEYNYSDSLFALPSSEYHQDLAMSSLAFEFAACAPDNYTEKDPPLAKGFFTDIGFDGFKSYGYDENKTKEDMNGVACIVGYKNIKIKGQDATVIGCAIRGGGYMEEWGGNFIMDTGTLHSGFNTASWKVLLDINSFIGTYKDSFKNDVYFWVTGYSRAAAVANLVAAKLNDSAKILESEKLPRNNFESLNTDKSKVFCYTFETPKCTTDKKAASEAYDNIFNMVNPNDIVPKVAPYYGDFKFTRYGQSLYFPTRETTPGYGKLLKRYTQKYKEICPKGYVYSEEFAFTKLADKQTRKMGQMTFGNNLVKILTTEALQNRQNYVDNYQDALSQLVAIFAGGYHAKDNDPKGLKNALITDFAAFLLTVKEAMFLTNGLIAPVLVLRYKEHISGIIRHVLDTYTELKKSEIDSLVSQIDPLLTAMISRHFDYTVTTIDNLINNVGYEDKKNDKASPVFIYPHTDTVLTTWMALLGEFSESELNRYVKERSLQNDIKINCPVDVNVYDENNELVASIINDEVLDCGENWLSCYIDDDGQKVVTLPEDGRYRVEVTAREDCDVTVSSAIVDCDTVETLGVENYYSIDVKAEETVMISADDVAEDDALTRDIEVKKDEKVIEASETVTDVEDIIRTVTVESDTGLVAGGGVYDKGEFAALRALPEEGQKFDGWYVDDKLVSSDAEYRFCVTEDVTVTGKFSTEFTPGDVDGNGKVLANDARLALRASASLEKLEGAAFKAADVDGNGKILANDARQILRFSAQLIKEFEKADK